MGIVSGLIGILLTTFVIVGVLVGLWIIADRRDRRRKWTEQTSLYCADCEAVNDGTALFCGQCGSQNLGGFKQRLRREDQQANAEKEEIEQTIRRNQAIVRIRELCDRSYCGACARDFNPGTKHCTACGANIAVSILPDEEMYLVVQREFPDVIGSMNCFQALRDVEPEVDIDRRVWKHALDHVVRSFKRAS